MASGNGIIEAPPITGLPAGTKEAGQRVDYKPSQFELLIETKGVRLAWSRATPCPCAPINSQTQQPDPTCNICAGSGWVYFRNSPYTPAVDVGTLTTLQRSLMNSHKGMVIRGVIQGLTTKSDAFNQLGPWAFGSVLVSVRPDNRMGYYDRIVNLDGYMAYSQIVIQGAATTSGGVTTPAALQTRYPAICVNILLDQDGVRKNAGVDFDLSNVGTVIWRTGKAPAEGTRLTIHYLCHPVYLVVEHMHVSRVSPVKFKKASPITPRGDPSQLPIQMVASLHHLVSDRERQTVEV